MAHQHTTTAVITASVPHCESQSSRTMQIVPQRRITSSIRGKTNRSHMTRALEEITYPISFNFCAQEFGELQTYCTHVRLYHLPFPAPTIRENRHALSARQSRRHRQHPRSGDRGVEGPRQLRRTVSRIKQREGGASGSALVLTKPKRTARSSRKVSTRSCSRPSSKHIRRWETSHRRCGIRCLSRHRNPEADNMQKQTQTCAENVRQEGKGHTHEVHHSCGDTWATQWARERHRA